MLVVHGIPNCDTVKKARDWLDAAGLAYHFHDFKKSGVPEEALARWVAAFGWERLLNRQGTTWRRLAEAERAGVVDADSAQRLMRAQPSLIRRPVVQWADGLSLGFDAEDFAVRSRPCGRA